MYKYYKNNIIGNIIYIILWGINIIGNVYKYYKHYKLILYIYKLIFINIIHIN